MNTNESLFLSFLNAETKDFVVNGATPSHSP